MTARLSILIALLLSLTLGPVSIAQACAPGTKAHPCNGCCTPVRTCCAAPANSNPQPPASTIPQSQDGKQLSTPILLFVLRSMEPAEQPSFTLEREAVRLPARPLVEVTCIRLI